MHFTGNNPVSSKRRLNDDDVANKKTRPELSDEAKLKITTSNEWPVYAHPQGGSIKITPWGALRTYVMDDGEEVVKFEDTSFSEYSYIDDNNDNDGRHPPSSAMNNSVGNSNNGDEDGDTAMPSTPQSLYGNNVLPLTMYSSTSANQAIVQNQFGNNNSTLRLSPSDEVEHYVINGYDRVSTPPLGDHNGYNQEQEHYLGIVQHEEFDEREMEME